MLENPESPGTAGAAANRDGSRSAENDAAIYGGNNSTAAYESVLAYDYRWDTAGLLPHRRSASGALQGVAGEGSVIRGLVKAPCRPAPEP